MTTLCHGMIVGTHPCAQGCFLRSRDLLQAWTTKKLENSYGARINSSLERRENVSHDS